MSNAISGEPHDFPLKGELSPATTALVVIDMQHDFVSPDGYMHRLGTDLTGMQAAIQPIQRVLAKARAWGCHIIHTREGYAADLSDLQPWKIGGAPGDPVAIGDSGPRGRAMIRGEPGWEIIPELAPVSGEPVIDKPGYGAFALTSMGQMLADLGIRHLVITGVTTDCCVTSTLREALDRGYDCLVLVDCVGSSNPVHHEAAVTLMRKPSGVFGTTAVSSEFIAMIDHEMVDS